MQGPPSPSQDHAGSPAGIARRRLAADRFATWAVRAGGLAVVLSLTGIIAFLVAEVLPLFGGARVFAQRSIETVGTPGALLVDPHRTHVATLGRDAVLRVYALDSGALIEERTLLPEPAVRVARVSGSDALACVGASGRAVIAGLDWRIHYEEQVRVVTPEIGEPLELEFETGAAQPLAIAARLLDGASTFAVALDDATLALAQVEVEVNDFTGERHEQIGFARVETPPGVEHMVIDPSGRTLLASARDGRLLWWEVARDSVTGLRQARVGSPVRAIELLVGGRALLVGREDGEIGVWFALTRGRASRELLHVRSFTGPGGPIRALAASERGRSFLVASDSDALGLYDSTSHRRLWSGTSAGSADSLAWAPRANGAVLASGGSVEVFGVDNPHPEAGLASYFSRIWYEGHGEPEYVWQSTGGTDEFEPKLSLVPLLFGTVKGTAYAMLLAIPLGIMGALYTSQFMAPALQKLVKPTVELMASLPSVVLGFLAGLWLAPRLEAVLPGMILLLAGLPLAVVAAGATWRALPLALTRRVPQGSELFLHGLAICAVVWACVSASPAVEAAVFGGSFPSWLLETTGLEYDQRNAIVAGVAMGFAVIPIVFALSEDAVSNVPRSLTAASLALGATPWQTTVRIVLPAASPGIFAAVMIGFGRAIGETMIVLMATGNTPLLDWSAFNGFRTLSANIAVEIPEAPQGATLYRTLFASAALLFLITFAINSGAELVRERLRRKFGSE